MNLSERVLAAKRAIFAAGFASGKFKPQGDALVVDVLVPVTFYDLSLGSDELWFHVLDSIRAAGAKTTDPHPKVIPDYPRHRPADLRTKEGRAWRAAQMAKQEAMA